MALVAATGFFDGVHSGHRAVLREIIRLASETGSESGIVTFWPHPRFLLESASEDLRLLNTLEEKTDLIRECGIRHVFVIPFTKDLSRMTAEDFISEILVKEYHLSTLVIGYDHRLGREKLSGQELKAVAESCGLGVSIVEEFEVAASHVSSTVIRSLIGDGNFSRASELLGYEWSVRYGDWAEGLKLLPSDGYYRIRLCDGGHCSEAECAVKCNSIRVYGSDECLKPETRIIFLERISEN
ncbi:MAG: FAD synthetase family protein [Alistipes sp.]|nr:FAD synthetase family protein [Candidatus Minthomonas equi]